MSLYRFLNKILPGLYSSPINTPQKFTNQPTKSTDYPTQRINAINTKVDLTLYLSFREAFQVITNNLKPFDTKTYNVTSYKVFNHSIINSGSQLQIKKYLEPLFAEVCRLTGKKLDITTFDQVEMFKTSKPNTDLLLVDIFTTNRHETHRIIVIFSVNRYTNKVQFHSINYANGIPSCSPINFQEKTTFGKHTDFIKTNDATQNLYTYENDCSIIGQNDTSLPSTSFSKVSHYQAKSCERNPWMQPSGANIVAQNPLSQPFQRQEYHAWDIHGISQTEPKVDTPYINTAYQSRPLLVENNPTIGANGRHKNGMFDLAEGIPSLP